LKNTVVLIAARVISRATTLVLTLLIAARLGAAGLGAFSTAMAIWGALTIVSEAGAIQFLIRELSKDPSRTSSYVVHLSVVAAGLAVLVIGGVELIARNVGYSPDIEASVSIALLGILPRVLNGIQEAAFIAHGRTELETSTTFVASVAHVGLSAYLLGHGYGVQAVIASFVAGQYLVTLTYFVLISRFIVPLRLQFGWPLARRLIGEVKAFAATSALGALFARPEVIILSLVASPVQVGYYGAALRVAEIWLFVPQVFMSNVYSVLSHSHHVGDGRFLPVQGRAIKYTLAFCLPLSAGLFAAASDIIPALFGGGFGPSIDILRLLALSLTSYSLIEVFWPSLFATGNQVSVLRAQLVMVALRLGGCALAVTWLGALGAAVASAVNSAFHLALLVGAARRHGGHAPIVANGWRLGLAAVLTGGLTWLATQALDVWLAIPIAAASYAVAAFVFRAFSPDELRMLRGLMPSRGT